MKNTDVVIEKRGKPLVHAEETLHCLVEYRDPDPKTGVEFRNCRIDYILCPNQKCIKKLL